MVTQNQIDSFHQFASKQLTGDGSDRSIDELYDMWRTQTATPEDLAAVQAAIDDMASGDRGVPVEEHIRQMRERHKLPE